MSDSDEEANMNMMEMEDTSRMSADSSRLSDSASRGVANSSRAGPSNLSKSKDLVTEFSKDMFSPSRRPKEERRVFFYFLFFPKIIFFFCTGDRYGMEQSGMYHDVKIESYNTPKREDDTISKELLKDRMNVLEKELIDLKSRRQQQELEVANIENMALRQRFQDILDNLLSEQMQKEQEVCLMESFFRIFSFFFLFQYNEVRLMWQKILRGS